MAHCARQLIARPDTVARTMLAVSNGSRDLEVATLEVLFCCFIMSEMMAVRVV